MRSILSILLVLILQTAGLGLASTRETTATVTINSTFTLALDPAEVNFGSVTPGTWKGDIPAKDGLAVTCKTNNDNRWSLWLHASGDLTDGTQTIALNNLKSWGWIAAGEAAGTFYLNDAVNLSTIPVKIYDCAAAETNNIPAGTKVHLQFGISVPETQKPGNYTTTIRLTMTE